MLLEQWKEAVYQRVSGSAPAIALAKNGSLPPTTNEALTHVVREASRYANASVPRLPIEGRHDSFFVLGVSTSNVSSSGRASVVTKPSTGELSNSPTYRGGTQAGWANVSRNLGVNCAIPPALSDSEELFDSIEQDPARPSSPHTPYPPCSPGSNSHTRKTKVIKIEEELI
ncbi:hypothetical protein L209DRAFT_738871 [Thermothelomyces heterothallicus CBS 203.75]